MEGDPQDQAARHIHPGNRQEPGHKQEHRQEIRGSGEYGDGGSCRDSENTTICYYDELHKWTESLNIGTIAGILTSVMTVKFGNPEWRLIPHLTISESCKNISLELATSSTPNGQSFVRLAKTGRSRPLEARKRDGNLWRVAQPSHEGVPCNGTTSRQSILFRRETSGCHVRRASPYTTSHLQPFLPRNTPFRHTLHSS